MAYLNRNDVEAEFDAEHLEKFLDDDNDGAEDTGLFAKLSAAVESEIAGTIATLPADVITALAAYLRHCAKVLFCSLAYRRKGASAESNPFETLAKDVRTRLADIQKGEIVFNQLKSLNYYVPARSYNKFLPALDSVENFGGVVNSVSSDSGELVLTLPDGKQYKMVVSYAGTQVVHSWEEVV